MFPGASTHGTVPFPSGKDKEGASLPPPAARAARPRRVSVPGTSLGSVPSRGDPLGTGSPGKGPGKASREQRDFPKSQHPHPGASLPSGEAKVVLGDPKRC